MNIGASFNRLIHLLRCPSSRPTPASWWCDLILNANIEKSGWHDDDTKRCNVIKVQLSPLFCRTHSSLALIQAIWQAHRSCREYRHGNRRWESARDSSSASLLSCRNRPDGVAAQCRQHQLEPSAGEWSRTYGASDMRHELWLCVVYCWEKLINYSSFQFVV